MSERSASSVREVGGGIASGHLRPGVLRRRLLPRDELVDRITAGDERFLLFTGPAGAGKSTALCQWAERWPNDHLGWLSLHPSFDAPVHLRTGLLAALKVALPEESAARIQAEVGTPLDDVAFVDSVASVVESAEEPVALVIDDLHVISNAESLAIVESLVRRAPTNLTLVIASRAQVGLGLARMRAAGGVAEVTFDDLAFSRTEVAELLEASMDHDAAGLAQRLFDKTNGWPAMVALAAQAAGSTEGLATMLDRGLTSDRWLAEFVVDELIDSQPASLRDFVVETAILGELCADLCDAVRERDDSGHLLDMLERRGLLVSLDDSGTWWRYHHLLHEHLDERADVRIPHAHDLRTRAAVWLGGDGRHFDAMRQALRAREFHLAAQQLVPALRGFQNSPEDATWWFDEIPDELMLADPSLVVELSAYIRMLGTADQKGRLDRLLAEVEGAPREEAGQVIDPASVDWASMIESDVSLGLRTMNTLLDAEVPRLWTEWMPPLGVIARYANDDVDGALELAETFVATGRRGILGRAMVAWMAVMLHELGRDAEAEVVIAPYLDVETTNLTDLSIEMGKAHHALRRGEREAVDHHFRRMISWIPETTWYLDMIVMEHAKALLALGDVEAARRVLGATRQRLERLDDPGALLARLDHLANELDDPLDPDPVRSAGRRKGLSPRELEVLPMLLGEEPLSRIADELFISKNTLKSHTRTIYGKLGVVSRAELKELMSGSHTSEEAGDRSS